MLGPFALVLRVLVVFGLLGATLWFLRRKDMGRGLRRGADDSGLPRAE